jgi:hypothetical protein
MEMWLYPEFDTLLLKNARFPNPMHVYTELLLSTQGHGLHALTCSTHQKGIVNRPYVTLCFCGSVAIIAIPTTCYFSFNLFKISVG